MLYVAQRSKDDPFFGATKLNKIVYHVDFGAYRRWLRPITGHAYFRLKEGPAPQALVKVRDR
ncbi:MAG: Panacea domain-containing protein, partial [Chloroflexota bacterium]|nr:Panacea domain-containing protein [Chloroflexota bacterium]